MKNNEREHLYLLPVPADEIIPLLGVKGYQQKKARQQIDSFYIAGGKSKRGEEGKRKWFRTRSETCGGEIMRSITLKVAEKEGADMAEYEKVIDTAERLERVHRSAVRRYGLQYEVDKLNRVFFHPANPAITVNVNTVAGVGEFVEVETLSPEDVSEEDLEKVAYALGLTDNDRRERKEAAKMIVDAAKARAVNR